MGIPLAKTAGSTREEAIAHLEGAMRDWAEERLRAKLDIPEAGRDEHATRRSDARGDRRDREPHRTDQVG